MTNWLRPSRSIQLPPMAYCRVSPTPPPNPHLVWINRPLLNELTMGCGDINDDTLCAWFSGQSVPPAADPIALAYAGHQFGYYTHLGDGRALLLGEAKNARGDWVDVQLKGSGPTPYARRGDGFAALGPMLREALISEAMFALGVPTTRALAVTLTGRQVWRSEALPAAVLTRVAASHLRVGTAEFFSEYGIHAVRTLADMAIDRHYPTALTEGNSKARYLSLYSQIAAGQAVLIAQWSLLGFVHGVMNTDNMALSGETIDYGPCAFLDEYNPQAVFSSIDHQGRYAFNQQSTIGAWNLARLAEALAPLFVEDEKNLDEAFEKASTILNDYAHQYTKQWTQGGLRKLGIDTQGEATAEQVALLADWRQLMAEEKLDYTNAHRHLAGIWQSPAKVLIDEAMALNAMSTSLAYSDWQARWKNHLSEEIQKSSPSAIEQRLLSANPVLIPRNHQVEAAINQAVSAHLAGEEDFTAFNRLMSALSAPYQEDAHYADLRKPPAPDQVVQATFCGT